MKFLRAALLRVAGLFSNRDRESEMTAELESHLQMQTEDNLRAGMSLEEARRQALLKLGGLEQTKQLYRDRATLPGIEALRQDVRFAVRQVLKHPGFAVTATLVLALGIGATTAIFSVVNTVLFKPLPYPHADRVAMIWEARTADQPLYVTFGSFWGIRQRTHTFEFVSALKPWQPAIVGNGEPERLEGQQVTSDYFRVLGVEPVLGRNFNADDDAYKGPQLVILSDRLWRRRFAADAAIVGRQITLDDKLYTVIGVMPRAFENVLMAGADIWAPLQYNPALPSDGREWGHHLQMIGRLRAGFHSDDARNELSVILQTLAQMYAKGYESSGGVSSGILVRLLQDDLSRDVRPALLAMLGAVLLVLLIACVNVCNLLLARGAQRRSEFAMRAAIGARRARLIQQMLTESLLLAIAGGVLGVFIAEFGVRVLVALSPTDLPRSSAIHLDPAIFAFSFSMTAFVGVLVGLIPALQAAHGDPHSGIQQSSRTTAGSHQVTRRVLVVCEVAIALVLLVSAGLLLRSIQRVFAEPPGFNASHLLTMQVQEYGRRFDHDEPARAQFLESALRAVRAVPGIVDAAFTSQLPLSGDYDSFGVEFAAYPDKMSSSAFRYEVTPGYFASMGIPLIRGRLLNEADRAGATVAVVLSDSYAKRMFPGGNAIGQRLRAGPDAGHPDKRWAVVVGVVGDVKQLSLALNDCDAFYTTPTQWPWVDSVQSLVVRTEGDPALLAPAIRQAIWSIDKDQPIVRIATMDKLIAESEAQRHFALVLFECFAVVALLLAATGLYGLLSGVVSERTRELGVRAALGASPRQILALMMWQGVALTVVGAFVGLVAALAASRALTSLLFGISFFDPATYGGVTAALLAVAALACLIPARRAARVDPAMTLRAE